MQTLSPFGSHSQTELVRQFVIECELSHTARRKFVWRQSNTNGDADRGAAVVPPTRLPKGMFD